MASIVPGPRGHRPPPLRQRKLYTSRGVRLVHRLAIALLVAACLAVGGCRDRGDSEGSAGRTAAGPAGGVRLPAIFGDHMVLQHGRPVSIWGWADSGSEISVTFDTQVKSGRVELETRRWHVLLDPLEPGGPYTLTVSGETQIRCENVLVGDVWLCAGQSNMEWPVRLAHDSEREIAAADDPRMRLITVSDRGAEMPQDDFDGEWVECRPQTVADFSAVGYCFGRAIRREVDIPIGLIDVTRGGASCEAFISRPVLEGDSRYHSALEHWDRLAASYDPEQARADYQLAMARWNDAALQARSFRMQPPRQPMPPSDPRTNELRPANLYNGMLAPIVGFPLRGAIWYQGETNRFRAVEYRSLFPLLIKSWRDEWGQGDFPFYFVQLANIGDVVSQPSESKWAELREAQAMTLRLPNTGQVVAIDLGEAYTIHPSNKREVGERLVLWALAHDYNREVVYSGPGYGSMNRDGNTIAIRFDHVAGGLQPRRGERLRGFAVAGSDRRFVWAEARIDGDRVLVFSPEVAEPVAVRYGWADNPDCNLYNSAGLPASPFRTDDWPDPSETRD